jgi:hypothetical protein
MSTRTVWPGSRRPAWSDLLPRDARANVTRQSECTRRPLSLLRSGKWGFVRRPAFQVIAASARINSFVLLIQPLRPDLKHGAAITLLRPFGGTLNAAWPHWEDSS